MKKSIKRHPLPFPTVLLDGDRPFLNVRSLDQWPKFEKGVSFLTWAYNEEILIGPFLKEIDRLLSRHIADYEIVVIDDGSRDRTNRIVRNMQRQNHRIRLLTNEKNRDVGYAMQRAIAAASKEYLFWQTVDWAYDISRLRYYLELLKYHDVVAGVRHAPTTDHHGRIRPVRSIVGVFHPDHLAIRSDNIKKSIISAINYTLIRLLFQVPLSDFQNVVFYRTRFIQSITLESHSSFTNPEMLIQSFWKGASIIEVPISFKPRQAGQAKGTRPKALAATVSDIFRLGFKWMILGQKAHSDRGRVIHLDRSQWDQPGQSSEPSKAHPALDEPRCSFPGGIVPTPSDSTVFRGRQMFKDLLLKLVYHSGLWFRNLFMQDYIDALKDHCQGKILDVGGGNFYEWFKKKVGNFTSYTNLECDEHVILDEYPIRHRQYRNDPAHHTVYGDGTRMPFKDRSFDTVLNAQVLEHIFDPLVMVEAIYHVLKPGGKAIFMISQTTPVHGIPFHSGNLSLYGAREVFRRTGFRIIEEKFLGGLWRTILFRHIFFFLQLFRFPGYSCPDFKRRNFYFLLAPFMALYALLNVPFLFIFSLADHQEDANNLVFVVQK